MADIEKQRAQKRNAAKTFRQKHPEKIKEFNQAYYSANQQEILENLRQKRIDQIDPTGVWIHTSQDEEKPDLPQSFNHVDSDCRCQGRRCKECEKVKCIGWFYRDKRRPDMLVTLCKLCYGQKVKSYKESHRDEVDASTARYAAESKVKRRRYWLKRLYNLTEEQYDDMHRQQNGCCAICGCVSEKTLHVDHDHGSGQVRSLLCSKCNGLIGYADESVERLKQAIEYLERHQKEGEYNG